MEEALSRLDDGTYGRCGTCGGVIEDGRLAELPMTQSCASCASPTGPGPVSGHERADPADEEDARSDPGDSFRDIGSPADEE